MITLEPFEPHHYEAARAHWEAIGAERRDALALYSLATSDAHR